MSSLVPADFSASEVSEINARLDAEIDDSALLDDQVASETALQTVFQAMEDANIRVHDREIYDLLVILLAVVEARNAAEPTEAPHSIHFASPPPSGTDEAFPVVLANLTEAGGLPGSIPSYTSPYAAASIENGDLSAGAGGWELWHKNAGTGLQERDPNQPSAGELTVSYPLIVAEFAKFQTARLHGERGSYSLLSLAGSNITWFQDIKQMIEDRNQVYKDIGFTGS